MKKSKLFLNPKMNCKTLFYRLLHLFFITFIFILPQVMIAQVQIIGPNAGAGGGNAPAAVRAATASANIKTAILFLQNWGLNNEAANIQKWFDDLMIYHDPKLSGAETSTTTGSITLSSILLTGGDNGNPALQHKFDPANAADKELIVELAFTLVHEKVHAHQSFLSFGYDRQGNEAEAYNKEIIEMDNTLNKLDAELNKAINAGNKAKEKELLDWIRAVLDVKISAIRSFESNYPKSRRISWPDRVIQDLIELRRLNDSLRRRASLANAGPDNTNSAFGKLLAELNIFEESLPAKTLPAYWMTINKNTNPYVEIVADQNLRIVIFNIPQGQVIVSLPAGMEANKTISGSIKIITKDSIPEMRTIDQTELEGYMIEVNGQNTKASNKNFVYQVSANDINEGFVVSLHNKEKKIGSAIVFSQNKLITNPTSINTNNNFILPVIAIKGTAVEIIGPFDGNSSNTQCKIDGKPIQLIAESSGKLLIMNTNEIMGPGTITIKEGAKEIKGEYNNVDLQLTVSNSNLLKGQKAILTIIVNGLQGLQKKVLLKLESNGVVRIKGGNQQLIAILPGEIGANGQWTQTRTVTGVQKGIFQVTASVK